MRQAQITAFGQSAGQQVQRIALRSDVLEVGVLTLGAILHSVYLAGLRHSLVVGFDSAKAYRGAHIYCGAIVGPVAGRLQGAEAMIGDKLWRFIPNDGRQLLHSGHDGLHQRLWQITALGEDHVTLALDLAHCEGGFPGKRRIEARYRVTGQTLALDLVTRSDRPTLANLAPHAFWNLGGHASLQGHRLRVAADHVLPVGPELYPIADPEPVAGHLDLRQGQWLGHAPSYDQCFCLSQTRQPMRPVAWLDLPDLPDGPSMEMSTTEPGLQIYDGGRDQTQPFFGVALESQGWPDAPNHPNYPPILLRPEDGALVQSTRWALHAAPDGRV